MRFMVIVKATKSSEAGALRARSFSPRWENTNEELTKAGLLAGEGLQPSLKGARVRFAGEKQTVIDGPFAKAKELVAGFWLEVRVGSEEAIEWVSNVSFDLRPSMASADC